MFLRRSSEKPEAWGRCSVGRVGHNAFDPTNNWPVGPCSLILRKICKIGAIKCQILRLKYVKLAFRWGFAPDPAGGAYSAPPDSKQYLTGLLLRGGREQGEEERERGRKCKEEGREEQVEGFGPKKIWRRALMALYIY